MDTGAMIDSKYRIEELLGSGGMGNVYRATNTFIERPVAIKVLRAEHLCDAELANRFLLEARVANIVQHPNIVDVLDVGTANDGSPFIVQELLVGEDLASFVRRHGRLDLEQVRQLVLPIIEAVAAAHANGVIHRDIKPANVFLAQRQLSNSEPSLNASSCSSPPPSSRQSTARIPANPMHTVPKLLDFGVSRLRRSDIRSTDIGLVLGTPSYMAPEIRSGAREADERSDVWAIGVMLFELLAGRRPFGPGLIESPPSLVEMDSSIAPDVSGVVDRCLSLSPPARFASAGDLASALERALAQGISGGPPAPSFNDGSLHEYNVRVPGLAPAPLATVSTILEADPGLTVSFGEEPTRCATSASSLPPSWTASHPIERPSSPSVRQRHHAALSATPRSVPLGLAISGMLLTLGALTAIANQFDAWELVRTLVGTTPSFARLPIALVVGALGVRRIQRASHACSSGDQRRAAVASIVSGLLFFCALELLRRLL